MNTKSFLANGICYKTSEKGDYTKWEDEFGKGENDFVVEKVYDCDCEDNNK